MVFSDSTVDGIATIARVHLLDLIFFTDLSNFNSNNPVIMLKCDSLLHQNHAN